MIVTKDSFNHIRSMRKILILGLSLCGCLAHAFTTTVKVNTRLAIRPFSSSNRRTYMSLQNNENTKNNNNSSNNIMKLQQQAAKAKLEAERLEAKLTLEKLSKLESRIQKKGGDEEDIVKQILQLAQQIDPNTTYTFQKQEAELNTNGEVENDTIAETVVASTNRYQNWKTEGTLYELQKQQQQQQSLSKEELQAGCDYFETLPQPLKQSLMKLCELDSGVSTPIIVLALYERRKELTPQLLQQAYQNELRGGTTTKITTEELEGSTDDVDDGVDVVLAKLLEQDPEQYRMETMVNSLLPRVTREGNNKVFPALEDAQLFSSIALSKDTFQPSSPPIAIPGGYMFRGENKCTNSTLLLQKLDELMSTKEEWMDKFQVCYIMDPTPSSMSDDVGNNLDGDPVLMITTRDLSPTTSRFLLYPFTIASLFLTLVFSLSIYGANDTVMSQLSEMVNSGTEEVNVNDLLVPFLGALAIPQVLHEFAHLFVAWKYNFKITPPTILPLLTLPYLSFQNKCKTSPPNQDALFALGFWGPAVGMLSSLALLLVGLQLSLEMSVDTAPALPVGFLKLSTLGGTLVDTIMGGGDGILLGQEVGTAVPLHPVAIAGLVGLMIQSLDVIPIGSTDGGRMSQSLLGRSGHLVFSGFIYFGLIVYVIFNPDHRDLFLTYLLFAGFAQKDMEVPCRDEVKELGISQAAASLLVWSIAILTLVPLS